VGIGRFALDRAARYASQRVVWDAPIAAHQGISHVLAKAKIEVETAALMTAKAAWLHDQGEPAGEASNMAKYCAAEAALAAIDAAIQCHGGNGVSTEYGLIPLWGLARLLRIAPVGLDIAGGKALFAGAREAADPERLAGMRKDLPVYIVVGDMDPVNGQLVLVNALVEGYRAAGLRDVTLRVWTGARHEVFNEINRDEIIAAMVSRLDDRITASRPAAVTHRPL
jgi:hypothetical protein